MNATENQKPLDESRREAVLVCTDLLKRTIRSLKLLREVQGSISIRQIINMGDDAINLVGLNPWCINEGDATGDESINLWWLGKTIEELEAAAMRPNVAGETRRE